MRPFSQDTHNGKPGAGKAEHMLWALMVLHLRVYHETVEL